MKHIFTSSLVLPDAAAAPGRQCPAAPTGSAGHGGRSAPPGANPALSPAYTFLPNPPNHSPLPSPLYSRCCVRTPRTPPCCPPHGRSTAAGRGSSCTSALAVTRRAWVGYPGEIRNRNFKREKVFQSPDTTSLSASNPCSWAQRCPADVPIAVPLAVVIHTITSGVTLAARTLPTSDLAS